MWRDSVILTFQRANYVNIFREFMKVRKKATKNKYHASFYPAFTNICQKLSCKESQTQASNILALTDKVICVITVYS